MPRKAKKAKASPRIPCGDCISGFRIRIINGVSVARRCHCWISWKRGTSQGFTGVDYKAKAAGEEA